MPTPYETLGVSAKASQDEIRAAYRELAKKFHPDLNPGNKNAEQKFKEITAAYEQVGSPENRAKYDRGETRESPGFGGGAGFGRRGPFYHETQEPGFAGGPGGHYSFSFDDIADLFGEMPGTRDENYRLEISLRDSVVGTEREIALPSGKKLSVKIPAGIRDGARLRFAGMGRAGKRGRPPGDVYVEIGVAADPRFEVRGSDLVIEVPVTLAQAVLGGEIRVPTVEGEVLLKVPRHSNTGRRLRLARKGVYDRGRGARGDQIVVLKVVLPEAMDAELEEAIRRWAERDPRAAGMGAASSAKGAA